MTLRKILEMGLIADDTEVFIRDNDMHVIAHGNWFQDNVLEHMTDDVECFTWQDDNKFYVDLREKQQKEIDTTFTEEELKKVETEEERQHLIECAADNSKLDEWYMQIMTKYNLWK